MSNDANMVCTDVDLKNLENGYWFRRVPIANVGQSESWVWCDGDKVVALLARLAAAENPKRQQEHEKYQCGRSCERCIADKAWLRACGKVAALGDSEKGGKPMDSDKPGQARTAGEIANSFCEKLGEMAPSARWLNLTRLLESYATEYAEERVREVKRDAMREIGALETRLNMDAKLSVERGVREVTKVECDKCAYYCAQRDAFKGEFEKEKYRVGEMTREFEDRVNEAVREALKVRDHDVKIAVDNSFKMHAEGYKAGQIAMRERAAIAIDEHVDMQHDEPCAVSVTIRSLPIEEKPCK